MLKWFWGADVANALDYANPYQAVRKNVDEEDRVQLNDLALLSGSGPPKHNDGLQACISGSGLYRAQLKHLMVLSESTILEYHEGAQVFISESGLYLLTSLRIRVLKDGVFA